MSYILALIIFSAIVIFHEFGHFLLAKWNGIEVIEFSLGMGQKTLKPCVGRYTVFAEASADRWFLSDGRRGRSQRF